MIVLFTMTPNDNSRSRETVDRNSKNDENSIETFSPRPTTWILSSSVLSNSESIENDNLSPPLSPIPASDDTRPVITTTLTRRASLPAPQATEIEDLAMHTEETRARQNTITALETSNSSSSIFNISSKKEATSSSTIPPSLSHIFTPPKPTITQQEPITENISGAQLSNPLSMHRHSMSDAGAMISPKLTASQPCGSPHIETTFLLDDDLSSMDDRDSVGIVKSAKADYQRHFRQKSEAPSEFGEFDETNQHGTQPSHHTKSFNTSSQRITKTGTDNFERIKSPYGTITSIPNSPNGPKGSQYEQHPLLDNDQEIDKLGFCYRCCIGFWKAQSLKAKGTRLFVLTLILLLPGILLHFIWPDIKLDNDSPLFWIGIGAFLLMGYPILLYLMNVMAHFCYKNGVMWSGVLFYISECKRHISLILYLIIFTVLWNVTQLCETELWRGNQGVVNKVIFALAISAIIFAYKRHLVNKLALGFNYSNYRERIQDCLFADEMIHVLQKSKYLHRTRRKAQRLLQLQKPKSTTSPPIVHPSAFLTLNPKSLDPSKRWVHTMTKPKDSGKSDVAIDIFQGSGSSQSMVNMKSSTALEKGEIDEQSSDKRRSASPLTDASSVVSSPVGPDNQKQPENTVQPVNRSQPAPPDETFNPFNFQIEMMNFQKLLTRTLDQFHATKSTLYRGQGRELASSEIRSEARSLAKKLYKWILPVDQVRNIMTKQDLSCIIEDPSSLDRLWGMLYTSDERHPYQRTASGITTDTEKTQAPAFYAAPLITTSNEGNMSPRGYHRKMSSISGSYAPMQTITPPSQWMVSNIANSGNSGVSIPMSFIQFYDMADFIERTWLEIIGIAKSLNSMEAAVKKLDIFFSASCVLILLIFLALFFGDFLQILTSITTILLSFSFAFTESAKHFFESVIFLFVTHPFDVGDRVYVNTNPTSGPIPPISLPSGGVQLTNASPGSGALENLVVLEMNLITTLFERWDGARIYIPNYVLATRPVINIRRSGALYEVHRLQLSFDTPVAKLNELRKKVEAFLKKESSDYTEELLMNVELIENLNRLHFLVMVQHRTNWQDFECQLARKSKILMFLKEAVESLGIQYCPPVQRLEILNDCEMTIEKRVK